MSHKCNIACDTACGIDMGLRAEQCVQGQRIAHVTAPSLARLIARSAFQQSMLE